MFWLLIVARRRKRHRIWLTIKDAPFKSSTYTELESLMRLAFKLFKVWLTYYICDLVVKPLFSFFSSFVSKVLPFLFCLIFFLLSAIRGELEFWQAYSFGRCLETGNEAVFLLKIVEFVSFMGSFLQIVLTCTHLECVTFCVKHAVNTQTHTTTLFALFAPPAVLPLSDRRSLTGLMLCGCAEQVFYWSLPYSLFLCVVFFMLTGKIQGLELSEQSPQSPQSLEKT